MMIKSFFKIEKPYAFEWNDVFGVATFINTLLVIRFGLVASWFGLAVALASVTDDLVEVRKINLVLLHSSLVILNTYFLLLYYNIL